MKNQNIDEANKLRQSAGNKRITTILTFLSNQPRQQISEDLFMQWYFRVFNMSSVTYQRDVEFMKRIGYLQVESITSMQYIKPKIESYLEDTEQRDNLTKISDMESKMKQITEEEKEEVQVQPEPQSDISIPEPVTD